MQMAMRQLSNSDLIRCTRERALQWEGMRHPARQSLRETTKYGTIQTRTGEGLCEGTCDNDYWVHQGGLGSPSLLHMPLTITEVRTQRPVLDHEWRANDSGWLLQ